MTTSDRGALFRPLYLLSWVFTFLTVEGWFTLLSRQQRRLSSGGGMSVSFDPEVSARILGNLAWGAALGGGVIVFLVGILFTFPGKWPLCGVLLLTDVALFLVGTVNGVATEGRWMVGSLAMGALVGHHLLYVTAYCF